MELNGRVAVITGGASGVGAATARRLAGLGATVVVADRDRRGATEVVATLAETGSHRSVMLDVGDAVQWRTVTANIIADLGRIDIVHLNAGVMTSRPEESVDDPTTLLTESGYLRVMSVNADGVVFGVLAVLPHLEPRGGDIIVTASVAGLRPLEIDPFYSMSKHAVVGFVRSLAGLQARGIRVNAICPGGIDTAIVPDHMRAKGITLSPPSYIADVVVDVLASEQGGQVWVAPGAAEGAWTIEPAPLRPLEE